MNNYEVTKCPKCREVILHSEIGSVKVAGYLQLSRAVSMLANLSVEEVASNFCSRCLFHKDTHETEKEYNSRKKSGWLPCHEFQPQDNRFV